MPAVSGEVDLFASGGAAYHGTGGKLDLKLKHAEKRKGKGEISDEEYQKERKDLLGGGARSEIKVEEGEMGPAAAGYITVQGTILYTDSAGNTHPVRGAEVEILDEDTLFDDLIATVSTDDAGQYTATVENDTGFTEKGLDIFIRVKAKAPGFYVESGGAFGEQHRRGAQLRGEPLEADRQVAADQARMERGLGHLFRPGGPAGGRGVGPQHSERGRHLLLGDRRSTWSQNIESGGGVGEDDELSVVGVLWDLFDSANDGEDKGISFSDKLIWDTIKSARPEVLSDFYQAFNNGKPIPEEALVGCLFSENNIGPSNQTPANGYTVRPTPIPTFSWTAHMNDTFVVEFYDSSFSQLLFASPEQTGTNFTPTQEQWESIREGIDPKVNWLVKGSWSDSPETGPYTSCKRKMKKPNQLDVVFLVDTTGSMWDDIANVQASARAILDAISAGGRDFRVAVADYKDHPVFPHGEPEDYPYRAVLVFTNDRAAITGAINSLSASGGWDWPESVFSGMMGAITSDGLGGWRKDAQKIIIVMADAPPHDPEPVTGYTHAQVVEAARKAGIETDEEALSVLSSESGARIFSVVVGGDTDAYAAFASLSEETGGEVFRAATASEVSEAILEAIGAIDDEPSNRAPDVTGATPSIATLWPVNHKMVEVEILNVVDPEGDEVTITITAIRQNQPVNDEGSGNTSPDGEGVGSSTARVRAERSGDDGARVYQIFFTADDGKGGLSEGSVLVSVPHDQRPNAAFPTDTIEYDSTVE